MIAAPPILEEPGRVARITLNRPEARNAVSLAMLEALVAALRRSAADETCRAVVVGGAGVDFCAGADVSELGATARDDAAAAYGRTFEEALRAIEDHPRPVVAAVHGAALGAGCQLALACDLIVAARDARFGIPSGRLGIVIPIESIRRLALALGAKRAAEVLLAASSFSGAEAAAWGLANRLAETAEAVPEEADALAREIADLAPLSVAASKRGIRDVLRGAAAGAGGAWGFEALAARALASEDLLEGLRAFRERRPPIFRGR